MAIAAKRAIDTADNMSKAAQKVGVATEALSRLNYAAGYSDVSLEQLTGGLQRLTKNLADVASGKGATAAVALQALGISATDSTGKLRAADEVFAEIADRFSRLEDGSTKTALAIQLFGRTGADLIPLLNSGRDGLQAMADESDRLGVTVSTKTGRAAEQFNDTLTKVGRIIDGVAMKVAEAALPALQDLADLLASPEVAQAAQTLGTVMVQAFDAVVRAVVATTNAIKGFLDWLNGVDGGQGPLLNQLLPGEKGNLADAILNASGRANSPYPLPASSFYSGFGFGPDGKMLVQPPATPAGLSIPNFGDGNSGASAEGLSRRLEALRESLRTEEESEKASFERRRAEIQKFYDEGLIQRGEYDELMLKAQQEHADTMTEIARRQVEEEMRLREQLVDNVASVFGSISSVLESMGDKNLAAAKAFAVAEAIINTAQGITKALAQGGVLGFAGAAAVAAAGAAQISTILSTQKGSSSKPGVNGSTSSAAVTPAQSQPSSTVNVTLTGKDGYTRDQVRELLESIEEYSRDGSMIRVIG